MALTFDRVGVTLDRRTVVADVSVALLPGRVTAIIGPNGAGKSTLLRAACGLVPATGAIWLGDRSIAELDPRTRACAIGYLPQDAMVHWNMPAREVVALGRLPHRAGEAADAAAIDAALAATDATQFADRPILSLSGGERARVLLARVLAGAPDWILADEPLASLDPAHRFALLDLLRAQAARGVGVGVVLHDLALAGAYADDAILLDGGRVVAHGHALDVLSPSRIAQVFRVRARRSGDALVIEGPL